MEITNEKEKEKENSLWLQMMTAARGSLHRTGQSEPCQSRSASFLRIVPSAARRSYS